MVKNEVPWMTLKERLIAYLCFVLMALGGLWFVDLLYGEPPDYSVWVGGLFTVVAAISIATGFVMSQISHGKSEARKQEARTEAAAREASRRST